MNSEGLLQLADIANCVAGDLHTLHLNVTGITFDAIHKVCKKYYEQADADYDDIAEAALMLSDTAPNKNSSAERIHWQSVKQQRLPCDVTVQEIKNVLETYVAALLIAFNAINKWENAIGVGVANMLQTKIEYWSKELTYFNRRREA